MSKISFLSVSAKNLDNARISTGRLAPTLALVLLVMAPFALAGNGGEPRPTACERAAISDLLELKAEAYQIATAQLRRKNLGVDEVRLPSEFLNKGSTLGTFPFATFVDADESSSRLPRIIVWFPATNGEYQPHTLPARIQDLIWISADRAVGISSFVRSKGPSEVETFDDDWADVRVSSHGIAVSFVPTPWKQSWVLRGQAEDTNSRQVQDPDLVVETRREVSARPSVVFSRARNKIYVIVGRRTPWRATVSVRLGLIEIDPSNLTVASFQEKLEKTDTLWRESRDGRVLSQYGFVEQWNLDWFVHQDPHEVRIVRGDLKRQNGGIVRENIREDVWEF